MKAKSTILVEAVDEEEIVGTEAYISPETIETCSGKPQITFGSDLWSLGVIIWQIFSKDNSTPFGETCQEMTFQNIKNCNYQMPEDCPEIAQDLIRKLLLKDPAKRLGAGQIEDLKSHPFFLGIDFESLYS